MNFRKKQLNATVMMLMAIAFVCLILIAMNNAYIDDVIEQQIYCLGVDEWNQSGGEIGHPDYNGNYDQICTKENNDE